jgi:hypothetical protein
VSSPLLTRATISATSAGVIESSVTATSLSLAIREISPKALLASVDQDGNITTS